MGRITVRDLKLYSYHGCFEEEQKIVREELATTSSETKKKKLVNKEFWFENEEDAYRFKSHIDSKMEATIIFAPELEEPLDSEFEDE